MKRRYTSGRYQRFSDDARPKRGTSPDMQCKDKFLVQSDIVSEASSSKDVLAN
ncbi:hypothetical protein F2Q70_00000017 [Brassica cretica]|uniref:Uncharacterized protein n=2 Tax=Brassica cretica TaxID=69181 RepID=A0A3N6QXR6_BRACR|nr:hypothetical protein F2Q68_00018512 [Brassica cretica]KAF2571369.1 hypothetical protein F2Q70_00000017 [Brassica cretica]KAF3503234.1 hypothetical protein F2Q69_00039356 [Brassica cretica]KAF3563608.1 hypothetical protein DY000_02010716 [Brassica cretica]